MTSVVSMLVEAAARYPTAECFVVSQHTWRILEQESQDHLTRQMGHVSTVQGLGQIAVCGIPVARMRTHLVGLPWIEVHWRAEDGRTPGIETLT